MWYMKNKIKIWILGKKMILIFNNPREIRKSKYMFYKMTLMNKYLQEFKNQDPLTFYQRMVVDHLYQIEEALSF